MASSTLIPRFPPSTLDAHPLKMTSTLSSLPSQSESDVSSIQDLAQSEIKICSQGTLGDGLELQTVRPKFYQPWDTAKIASLVRKGRLERGDYPVTTEGSLSALQNGYCGAAIVSNDEARLAISRMGPAACIESIAAVDTDALESNIVALPVNNRFIPYVNHMIVEFEKQARGYASALSEVPGSR